MSLHRITFLFYVPVFIGLCCLLGCTERHDLLEERKIYRVLITMINEEWDSVLKANPLPANLDVRLRRKYMTDTVCVLPMNEVRGMCPDEVSANEYCDSPAVDRTGRWSYVSPSAIRDFEWKNRRRHFFGSDDFADLPVQLLDSAAWSALYSHSPRALYDACPNGHGIYAFSRVGFSNGGLHAVVYYGHPYYRLSGSGYLVLLRKQIGGWSIVYKEMLWIS